MPEGTFPQPPTSRTIVGDGIDSGDGGVPDFVDHAGAALPDPSAPPPASSRWTSSRLVWVLVVCASLTGLGVILAVILK